MLFDLPLPSNLQEFLPFGHNFSQGLVYLVCWEKGNEENRDGNAEKNQFAPYKNFLNIPIVSTGIMAVKGGLQES